MAYSTVETQLMKQIDRFAKIKKVFKAAILGGTNFWNLVDATGDETYENRIKGSEITDLDSKFNNAKFGTIANRWFSLHNMYFNTDLGYANGLPGFLEAKHWRVHEDFAELYFDNHMTRLDPKYIYADEENTSNVLGTLDAAQTASTDAKALSTKLGNTRLGIKVTTPVSGEDFVCNITVTTYISAISTASTTFSNVTIPNNSAAGLTRYLGSLNVTYVNDDGATSTVFGLSGTATGFQVGGYMVVTNNNGTVTTGYGYDESLEDFFDADANRADDTVEYLKITAVDGARVTTAKARHAYTVGESSSNIMAYPCFNGISALSKVSASAGAVKVVPMDDRAISL